MQANSNNRDLGRIFSTGEMHKSPLTAKVSVCSKAAVLLLSIHCLLLLPL